MSAFSTAFAAARKTKGAGKTFTFNGKSYSTNTADDLKSSSTTPKTSPRPQANPKTATPIRDTLNRGYVKGSAYDLRMQKAANTAAGNVSPVVSKKPAVRPVGKLMVSSLDKFAKERAAKRKVKGK